MIILWFGNHRMGVGFPKRFLNRTFSHCLSRERSLIFCYISLRIATLGSVARSSGKN